MQQAHFLQKLYNRYYPRKNYDLNLDIDEKQYLPDEEKKKLSFKYLEEGELLLSKKDLGAIEYVNAAVKLNPNSTEIWKRQGQAFFTFGKLKTKKKLFF